MNIEQPILLDAPAGELTAVIASLAIGGAERVVLDWAARAHPARRAHIVVLRDSAYEWPVPASVRVTRLRGVGILEKLHDLGQQIARSDVPVCVCHLLTRAERAAIADGGAFVAPVIHNAREGWLEDAAALAGCAHVIAVSAAAAQDLRRDGCGAAISVVRHVPKPRRFAADARAAWRRAWRIPEHATVVGMIGAVKPQKDYPCAVGVLRRLLEQRDVYLAIVGGPVGRNGRDAWRGTLDAIAAARVRHRVAMPGFVADAAAALPAFDVLLNTSRYEGASVATLEALVNGMPVVASRVGGQGELDSDGLILVDRDAPAEAWTAALLTALDRRAPYPAWTGFPSHRLWTLAQLARPYDRDDRVLFVTANLNAGGAQRSLVNLVAALRGVRLEVAVTGDSTADYFFAALRSAGASVHRTAASRDAFDHAERLVERICAEGIGTVCFWNLDAKIKLLVAKALACTDAAIVDVIPGPSAFDEMHRARDFGRTIAFSENDFYARLDRLVLKYHGAAAPAECANRTSVIPNGVPPARRVKTSYGIAAAPRIVVNGRIAPTKFLVEIVEALRIVRRTATRAELHIFGCAEPRHRGYAESLRQAAGDLAIVPCFSTAHQATRSTVLPTSISSRCSVGTRAARTRCSRRCPPPCRASRTTTAERRSRSSTNARGCWCPIATRPHWRPRSNACSPTGRWPSGSAAPGESRHCSSFRWTRWRRPIRRCSRRLPRRSHGRRRRHDLSAVRRQRPRRPTVPDLLDARATVSALSRHGTISAAASRRRAPSPAISGRR